MAWYPTVGLHSAGEVATINLGQDAAKPFMFNVDLMESEQREAEQRAISACPLAQSDMSAVVRDFLLMEGARGGLGVNLGVNVAIRGLVSKVSVCCGEESGGSWPQKP